MTLPKEVPVQALRVFDLTVMLCSFALASLVAYFDIGVASFREFLTTRVEVQNFMLFGVLLLLWNGIFTTFNIYRSRRLSDRRKEFIDIVAAITLGTLLVWLLALAFNIEVVNHVFLAVFWVTECVVLLSTRLAIRFVLQRIRLSGRNLRYALIVGTNPRAMEIARKIQSDLKLGYRLVGFVDNHWTGNDLFQNSGHSIVSDLDGFQAYLKDHVVDEVFVCIPVKSFYEQSSRVLAQCEEQGITVRFDQDVFTPTMGQVYLDHLDGHGWVSIGTGAFRSGAFIIKRLLDFLASLALLTILAPALLLIALAIKLSSPGPVLFIQERVGLSKRRFHLFKFRTMVVDAERELAALECHNEVGGPVFKMRDDPRVTPLGKFLRRTSMDELPQLLNVLIGDMTLVGPRPLPVRDYAGFDQDWHRRRFSVRPGITCLWQIQGRSSISFDRWMELDMHYIDHWSLWLDIKILFKTIPAIFRGSGAY